ncbi:hypothetical protein [Rheinheimera sp.]|uniref:hypothetical protein n=1 Tax=Rheinheimera sp. TaxID=1869214 RepID=UPI00235573E9|nr:hypothetical protein [Rheinheimera sp.]
MSKKAMKVYPTFAYACGPKTAVFIILLHTAGLITFFETATYFLAPAIPQSALMMLASLASLILYAFIDVIAAVLLIKRLSKPIILHEDFLLFPPWTLESNVQFKPRQSLKIDTTDIECIKAHIWDMRKIPIFRRSTPIAISLFINTSCRQFFINLKHTGNQTPLDNWLKDNKALNITIEKKLLPTSDLINFTGVTKTCFGLSFCFGAVMPALQWLLVP